MTATSEHTPKRNALRPNRTEGANEVETVGSKRAKFADRVRSFDRGQWPTCGRVDRRRPPGCGRQQPSASRSARQACVIRHADSCVTRRRRSSGSVCTCCRSSRHSRSKHPSPAVVRTNSETSPRRFRVNAATTAEPIRSATGSRVSTRTGRSPAGVAADQISPLCIRPVRPILRGSRIGDRF
jgi:hypothetical protein